MFKFSYNIENEKCSYCDNKATEIYFENILGSFKMRFLCQKHRLTPIKILERLKNIYDWTF